MLKNFVFSCSAFAFIVGCGFEFKVKEGNTKVSESPANTDPAQDIKGELDQTNNSGTVGLDLSSIQADSMALVESSPAPGVGVAIPSSDSIPTSKQESQPSPSSELSYVITISDSRGGLRREVFPFPSGKISIGKVSAGPVVVSIELRSRERVIKSGETTINVIAGQHAVAEISLKQQTTGTLSILVKDQVTPPVSPNICEQPSPACLPMVGGILTTYKCSVPLSDRLVVRTIEAHCGVRTKFKEFLCASGLKVTTAEFGKADCYAVGASSPGWDGPSGGVGPGPRPEPMDVPSRPMPEPMDIPSVPASVPAPVPASPTLSR